MKGNINAILNLSRLSFLEFGTAKLIEKKINISILLIYSFGVTNT